MATCKTTTHAAAPALRVSQLDAQELDHEIFHFAKSQWNKIFRYFKKNVTLTYEPEIDAALKVLIWKFSVLAHGSTLGQRMFSLKYAAMDPSKATAAERSILWATSRQRMLYALILIGCPWLKERLGSLIEFFKLQKYSDKIEKLENHLEVFLKILSLINFVVFLRQGVYGSLTERLLGLRPVFPERQGARQVGFEYMTRELLWHGFSIFIEMNNSEMKNVRKRTVISEDVSYTQEFLVFALPLINWQKMKNFIVRKMTFLRPVSTSVPGKIDYTKCAICGESPTNPLSIGCLHVFCYFCLKSNYEIDPSYQCPLCGTAIPSEDDISFVKQRIL